MVESTDEGTTAKPVKVEKKKKLRVKPNMHYLTPTTASKQMRRAKSPMNKMLNTAPNPKGNRGLNIMPSSITKKKPGGAFAPALAAT